MKISDGISYYNTESMLDLNLQRRSGMFFRQPKVSNTLIENHNLSVDLFQRANSKQSFKGVSWTEILVRYFKNDIVRKPAERILENCNDFTIEEYKGLSAPSRTILRQFLPCPQSDIDELLSMYNLMRDNLKEKFPGGYTLVSIGRSPAVFAKLLKSQGEDVILFPISRLYSLKGLQDSKTNIFEILEDYFMKMGLNRELVENPKKNFVFTDYTSTGNSLKNFEFLLLNSLKLSKHKAFSNLHFLSFNEDLCQIQNRGEMDARVKKWLHAARVKVYSPLRMANIEDILYRKNNIFNHQMSQDAKLMQFHLIDRLEREKA